VLNPKKVGLIAYFFNVYGRDKGMYVATAKPPKYFVFAPPHPLPPVGKIGCGGAGGITVEERK